MEVTTIQRYLHTSPRKLRLVADMVRKMGPVQALNILKLTPKSAAKDLGKALSTVLANAKIKGMDEAGLIFEKIEINESMKMRRFRPGTRGRVRPFKRRMSHIKIVLTDDLNLKTQISNVKSKAQNEIVEKEEKKTEEVKK